jgi:membrane protein DedA with SNARE-associated domain
MSILALLVRPESVWKWIHGLGGPGLILLGVADNTPFISAPPGSVDAFVIVLSAHRPAWWLYYAFMATVGEVLGGYLSYRIAEKGGQETLEKKLGKPRAEKIYRQFEKHAFATVFVASMLPPPFPFTPVLMTAGVMHDPHREFLSALTGGRTVRFFAVAYLGRTYGRQVTSFFSRNYGSLLDALVALAIAAGIGALVYFKWYRPHHKADKTARNSSRLRNGQCPDRLPRGRRIP